MSFQVRLERFRAFDVTVWMLSIVPWLLVPRFAALTWKRLSATGFGEGIEAHHQTRGEVGGIPQATRIRRHDPVRRIDPVVAASHAGVRVAWKDCAVKQ